MTTTKIVKVYASAYTSRISTDIKDFTDTAIAQGDLHDFDAWLESDRDVADLYVLIAESAGQSKTCKEVLGFLHEDYEDYVAEQLSYLFECCTEDYWADEITVEVEVTMNSELDLEVKIEAV